MAYGWLNNALRACDCLAAYPYSDCVTRYSRAFIKPCVAGCPLPFLELTEGTTMERKTLTFLEIKNAMPTTHADGTQKQTLLSTNVPNLYVQITPSRDPKNPYRSWA